MGGDAVAGTVEFEAVNATLQLRIPDSDGGDFGLILGGAERRNGNGVVTGG